MKHGESWRDPLAHAARSLRFSIAKMLRGGACPVMTQEDTYWPHWWPTRKDGAHDAVRRHAVVSVIVLRRLTGLSWPKSPIDYPVGE